MDRLAKVRLSLLQIKESMVVLLLLAQTRTARTVGTTTLSVVLVTSLKVGSGSTVFADTETQSVQERD